MKPLRKASLRVIATIRSDHLHHLHDASTDAANTGSVRVHFPLGPVEISVPVGNAEALQYAGDIGRALFSAGWKITKPIGTLQVMGSPTGIYFVLATWDPRLLNHCWSLYAALVWM